MKNGKDFTHEETGGGQRPLRGLNPGAANRLLGGEGEETALRSPLLTS